MAISPYRDREVQALQIVNRVIDGMDPELNFKKRILRMMYREDYQDFRIVLNDKTHCEIREKLINEVVKIQASGTTPNKATLLVLKDINKEIQFRLLHAQPLEDWEDDPTTSRPNEPEVGV